jgi:hypothetical protein
LREREIDSKRKREIEIGMERKRKREIEIGMERKR